MTVFVLSQVRVTPRELRLGRVQSMFRLHQFGALQRIIVFTVSVV